MTLLAPHFHVHATQWILRVIVVEFRKAAKRRPCYAGVAVFARASQRAMRAANIRARIGLLLIGGDERQRRQLGADEQNCQKRLTHGITSLRARHATLLQSVLCANQ